jgi:hypothetical protein
LNDKCEFQVQRLQVLGHIVDESGIHPNPDLVNAITEAPVPSDDTQLRSWLGLLGYYSKFISQYSE